MMRFLLSLPKTILVAILLFAGVSFIILIDPPHTICHTQIENVKDSQKTFLIQGAKRVAGKNAAPDIVELTDTCKGRNSMGSCYELFHKTKLLVNDLDSVSEQCRKPAGAIPQVKKAIWDSLELMVKIAWTDKPPKSVIDKYNWLSTSDLTLFCNLKRVAQTHYSEDQWANFREDMLSDVPGAENLTREKAWELNLLSIRCNKYL